MLVNIMNAEAVAQTARRHRQGSPPDQNRYNLDGVAISLGGVSPIFFDFDALSDIEVTTGGSTFVGDPRRDGQPRNPARHEPALGSARALYTGGAGWDYGG